jgi:hypothetical protein
LIAGDQLDQRRQQRHVAIVVQLADGDPQRYGVAEHGHCIVGEPGELAGPDTCLGQDLNHEPPTRVGIAGQSGLELLHRRIVEELR